MQERQTEQQRGRDGPAGDSGVFCTLQELVLSRDGIRCVANSLEADSKFQNGTGLPRTTPLYAPRRLSLSSRAVTGLMGSHGVVIWPDGKTGFISDGRANAVVTFDPATFATTDKIPTGTEARGQSRRKQAASEESLRLQVERVLLP